MTTTTNHMTDASIDAIIRRALDALIAYRRDIDIDALLRMIDDFDNYDDNITHSLIDIIDNALAALNIDIIDYRDYAIDARAHIDNH